MTLGVSAYELLQFIKRLKLTGLSKTLLTIVKWLSFISVIVFAYFLNEFTILFR